MYTALIRILSKLPDRTVSIRKDSYHLDFKAQTNKFKQRVYCGHEYTIQNLKFSLHVEPDNQVTKKKLEWATEKRTLNEPTIPSTIGEEKLYNPFMRVDFDSLKNRYNETDSIACMQKLRKEKDNWKPT